jgi:AraC family transcriptional regulator
MKKQTVYIKNMCCQRCIDAINSDFSLLGLQVENVELGKAVFTNPSNIDTNVIGETLQKRGFELILSKENRIVEEVKIALIELIRKSAIDPDHKIHLAEYLEEKVKKPYRHIHKLFLQSTHLTIEAYLILQRIEKVKELIEQEEHNFSEIADTTGYKTLQHLSGQFRKITGMSMMEYKNSKIPKRVPIDKI